MTDKERQDDLSRFGKSFQEKLCQLILQDRPFSEQIEEVFEATFLELKYLQVFVALVFNYRKKYEIHPSVEIISSLLNTEIGSESEVVQGQTRDFFARVTASKRVDDAEYVKQISLDFCKKQKLKAAMLRSVELLQSSSFDQIKSEIDTALKLGLDNDSGHDFVVDFEARYVDRPRQPVSTGWPEMDEITGGGHGRGELGVVIAPTGCHRKGTEVIMIDGTFKKVEDVEVGDKLLGPDSTERNVLRLCRGRDTMYEIVPTKGQPFVVNSEHILSLKRTKTTNSYQNKNDGQIVNIKVKDYLSKSKWFKHTHKLYRPEMIEFEEFSELPLDPYFLGLMLGDGSCCNGNAAFCTADDQLAESVAEIVEALGMKITKYEKKDNEASNYNLTYKAGYNNPLQEVMKDMGLYGRLSGDKFIPHEYKVASIQDRKEILAGLIDTDGHMNNSNCYEYMSKSERLADDVCFVVRSLGLAAYKSEKPVKGTIYYRVSISGDCSDLPIRLGRKRSLPREQKKSVTVTGFKVLELAEEDFYGFTLDADHLYMLNDFTVTHNSGKSMALVHLGAQALLQGKNVVYYTLELDELVVGKRFDSCITGISLNDLSLMKNEVLDVVRTVPGELIIKEYPTKSASTNTIRQHLQKLKMRDKKIDMIVVDYGDLLRPTRTYEQKRMELETIYEELRGLAKEFNCPVWTASQTNRSGLNAEVITMEAISEAFNKCFVSDFIFTISRTIDDKNNNTGRIFIAKNRNGQDGLIMPIFMDTSKVAIKVLGLSSESIEDFAEKAAEKQKEHLSELYLKFKEQGGK